jgi:hypothetical protein
MISMRVDGALMADVLRRFNELNGADARRAFHVAGVRASAPMVAALRAAVPVRTGALKKNIGIRRARRGVPRDTHRLVIASRDVSYALVPVSDIPDGARSEFIRALRRSGAAGRRRVNPSKYWHLVFGGTRPHAIRMKRSGIILQHPGARANDAMRNVFAAQSAGVIAAFSGELRRAIERVFAKVGRR